MASLLTVTLFKHGGKQPSAPLIPLVVNVDFDAYATGGCAFDPLAEVKRLGKYDKSPELIFVSIAPMLGYQFEYDATAKKILVYWGNNDGGADGPGVEVTNGQDLSAITGLKVLVLVQ